MKLRWLAAIGIALSVSTVSSPSGSTAAEPVGKAFACMWCYYYEEEYEAGPPETAIIYFNFGPSCDEDDLNCISCSTVPTSYQDECNGGDDNVRGGRQNLGNEFCDVLGNKCIASFSEEVAEAWDAIESGSVGEIVAALANSEHVYFSESRQAIQATGCGPGVAMNVPVSDEIAVALRYAVSQGLVRSAATPALEQGQTAK